MVRVQSFNFASRLPHVCGVRLMRTLLYFHTSNSLARLLQGTWKGLQVIHSSSAIGLSWRGCAGLCETGIQPGQDASSHTLTDTLEDNLE